MKSLFVAAIAAVLALTGCALPTRSTDAYSRGEIRNAMEVRMGTLEGIRLVKLEGSSSAVGVVAGGALGGLAGSTMGKGRGKTAMTILGILAGIGAGAAIEERATAAQGLELIVRMDNGRVIAVVQEPSGEMFSPGQRVRVMTQGRTLRVTPA